MRVTLVPDAILANQITALLSVNPRFENMGGTGRQAGGEGEKKGEENARNIPHSTG